MVRLRELHVGENLPLRRQFASNVSIDRFSERSLHGLNLNDRTCSKCLCEYEQNVNIKVLKHFFIVTNTATVRITVFPVFIITIYLFTNE